MPKSCVVPKVERRSDAATRPGSFTANLKPGLLNMSGSQRRIIFKRRSVAPKPAGPTLVVPPDRPAVASFLSRGIAVLRRLAMWRLLMRPFPAVLLLCITCLGAWWYLSNTSFIDGSSPTIEAANPAGEEFGVPVSSTILVTFRKAMRPGTISNSAFLLRDSDDRIVPAIVNYESDTHNATLKPHAPLAYSANYRVTIAGGPSGVQDSLGKTLVSDLTWNFATGAPPPPPPTEGPGGPILVIATSANPFSRYYAEILRNEGFNEFAVADISLVTAVTLKKYDIVILGEFPLAMKQVAILTDWVRSGGNLIAMRPDPQLAPQIGLNGTGTTLRDGYLSINTSKPPGTGLVNETVQFHGTADLYESNGSNNLATLYANATVATTSPAVTLMNLGKGLAAAFTYDLARSVVYTRQGNPEWEGTERDGIPPIRSDDLFYGAASSDPQPDWVDLNKVAIPQADVQQRFLANLILYMNYSKKPLPRFWYFPHGSKAVVIMTGDDHGHGGTVERFMRFQAQAPPNCSLADWQCVRGTSNIFVGTITASDAAAATEQGFEIGLHVYTKCIDWPSETYRQRNGTLAMRVLRKDVEAAYSSQLASFAAAYPRVPAPRTNRIDCVTWGDYDTQPQVEFSHGIRLDTNYYYWPPKWVGNRPGMFTGSGMPMRFAKLDGSLIDVYQATTQMTDESGQTYPFTINSLLSNALGPNEYYGAFTANMHTDFPKSPGADAIVAAAKARRIPVVTAGQMLTWLDGRNGSSFQELKWNGHDLEFTVSVGAGGNGIRAMLPMRSGAGTVDGIWFDDEPVAYVKRTVTGLEYAEFPAPPGRYKANYARQQR